MRHASFFSGVGGLDLGFERAGIKTVSVCEIDPYASSVLAERFPEAPNLGSITEINADDIPEADIWSGGFPCQDLSVAGKRAGFAGKRSSLAFTFLDLVERRRPRWIVLENVPGLFSSNHGADFARLLHEMEQLGYSVAWRTLDARYFGVPQRRRRVFIVASLERDRAAEVLFECEGCERHPAPSWSKGKSIASSTPDGFGIISTLQARMGKGRGASVNTDEAVGGQLRIVSADGLTIGATTDADGMRTTDGMARRLDDQQVVETIISFPSAYSRQPTKFNNVADPLTLSAGAPAVFRKSSRAQTNEDSETWVEGDVANTINAFDVGDIRTTHAIIGTSYDGFNQKLEPDGAHRTLRIGRDSSDFVIAEGGIQDDPLLPEGLDGHRYRCCGNGVVAPVAEWIGNRIIAADAGYQHDKMLRAMDDAADFAEDHEVPYRDD
ncbi:MAG: DNA (cytosine-5-)-methyltransferase [Proteobacteria bacterium]|nr:DNA (cytosine-5-)-methyltransferase [Pseudomonadota bacterium]